MIYLEGFSLFLLGCLIYLLGKMSEYKKMAKAHPDPLVKYSFKEFMNEEWINYTRLLLGGIALVILGPMIAGKSMVDLKTSSGFLITSISLQSALLPLYFFMGYGGNSALFNLFGKYKNTFMGKFTPQDEK